MRFLELKKELGDQLVFTFSDAKKIDGKFDYRRLTEWQKKGHIRKIIKGYYIFSDTKLTEERLFSIANKIYPPSYISLESALRYYNFIPEGIFTITSVSTKKTNKFETEAGSFSYRKIKNSCFFGYRMMGSGGEKVKIAAPEKAIIDYFYFNPGIKNRDDINSLRINKESFFEEISLEELQKSLLKINSKSLQKRIDKLLLVLKNA